MIDLLRDPAGSAAKSTSDNKALCQDPKCPFAGRAPHSHVVVEEVQRTQNEYLGDGVYASWDGYQIWLSVNDHDSPPVVALDRGTMAGLMRYAKQFYGSPK